MGHGSALQTTGKRNRDLKGMKVTIKKLNIILKLKYQTLFLKLKYLITKKIIISENLYLLSCYFIRFIKYFYH